MTQILLTPNDIKKIAKYMDFEANDRCEMPKGYTKYLLCNAIKRCKGIDFFKDLFLTEQLKRMNKEKEKDR